MEMPWWIAVVVGGGLAVLLLLRQEGVNIQKMKNWTKKWVPAWWQIKEGLQHADAMAHLFVGEGVAVFLLLRQVVVTIQKRMKKAQPSLDSNNNEDEAEHEEIVAETLTEVSKQKDPTAHSDIQKEKSVGSSMAVMPTRGMTLQEKALLAEAEELNEGVGSSGKELWTAHAMRDSTSEELSATALRERLTEMKETMRERVVRDGWYVCRREWVRFGKRIGEGGQAEVYAATVHLPSCGSSATLPYDAAVKKFKSVKGVSQGHNPPGLSSFECMHVCKPLGVCYDNGQLCLIMPRFPGDLRAAIDTEMGLHPAPPFPEPVATHIIMQLAMGLNGLHEVGIYHRDLKAGNVLVEKSKVEIKTMEDLVSYRVYISDFESSEDVIGTGFYRAPEVLRRVQDQMQGRVHVRPIPEHEWAAADVYSFGMVCYEILTGNVPKIGNEWSDYSKALSGQRPELPPHVVPEGLRILIQRCWHEDPESRPKPYEIIHLLREIDNTGVARAWWFEVEMMTTTEATSGILEEDLLELQVLVARHTVGYGLRFTYRYPEYIKSAMEFSNHVREFIPKFHAFSHLPQQSFPLQKFMELRKLLNLIDWRKCCFWREVGEMSQVTSDSEYHWQCERMKILMKRVHVATNKTILQRSRLASQERLHVNEKMLIFVDFVLPLLFAGVHMQYVWVESEIVIRQLDERWALRALLNALCMVYWMGCQIRDFIPALLTFGFSSQILGRIVLSVFGKDYMLFGYFYLSPGMGAFLLFLQRYIVIRVSAHWFSRTLCLYFLGYGGWFKYWFLLQILYCIVHTSIANMVTDFSPHCDFQPINSSTF